MILLADKNVVRVASLKKAGDADIVRPKWVFDCLEQSGSEGYLLPFEESHLFHATEGMMRVAEENTDQYGDSYARDVGVDELREIMDRMDMPDDSERFDVDQFLDQLEEHGNGMDGLKSFMFRRCRVHFALGEGVPETKALKLGNYVRFGNGEVVEDLEDEQITHVVVVGGRENTAASEKVVAADVRYKVSSRRAVPRIVAARWVEDCWKEDTLVDEEDYAPS
jgi:DNA ligase-4